MSRRKDAVGLMVLGMLPDDSAFERHYRIGELAKIWSLGRETVRLLVKDEPEVIKVRSQEGPDNVFGAGIGRRANPHEAAQCAIGESLNGIS
jgi:hypothetical protein